MTEPKALRIGLRIKTSLPMESIEDWLETNCTGPFRVDFEGLSDDRSRKELLVAFSDEADKAAFKDAYQRRDIG